MSFSYTVGVLQEQLGDYGHFTDSEDFCREGNLSADLRSLPVNVNITPRQHKISERDGHQRERDFVGAQHYGGFTELYKPLGLSLPSDDDFKSLLVSFSSRFTNRFLITRVIQCRPNPRQASSGTLYNIAKPFVWPQSEGPGSVGRAAIAG